jgi:hypothetical protein
MTRPYMSPMIIVGATHAAPLQRTTKQHWQQSLGHINLLFPNMYIVWDMLNLPGNEIILKISFVMTVLINSLRTTSILIQQRGKKIDIIIKCSQAPQNKITPKKDFQDKQNQYNYENLNKIMVQIFFFRIFANYYENF